MFYVCVTYVGTELVNELSRSELAHDKSINSCVFLDANHDYGILRILVM